jgi:uncharacterized surface anchored protein
VHVASRASGNSFNATLKDLVKPLNVTISNCGSLKVTKSADGPGDFDFTLSNGGTLPDDCQSDFTLADGESETCNDLFAGTYTITEADPGPEYALTDITCTGIDEEAYEVDLDNRSVDVTLQADDIVECTFTNERQPGSIVVIKVDDNDDLLAGAGFTIDPANLDAVTEMTEYADGVFCIDNLEQGDYDVTESTVPDGYTGGAPDTVTVDSASSCDDRIDNDGLPIGDVDSTFTNNPEPGTVNILKEDDDGNPLSGIGFTLFVDDNEDGIHQETETTVAKAEQFTDGDGEITFTDVPLGFYCAVETTPSPDHDTADPQCFEVGLGDAAGEGQTINLTFENPRKHRTIVLVCHEGTDTLHQADVELDGETKQSLSTAPGGLTDAQLCGLGGAAFGGISGHDTQLLEVTPDDH